MMSYLCTPWSSTWTGGRIVGKARPVTTFFTKSRTCINLPSLSNICEYYLLIWSILSEHCIRCTSLRLHNSDGFWWGISNRLKEFQVWVEIFRLFFGSRNVWQSQRVVFNLVTGCHSTSVTSAHSHKTESLLLMIPILLYFTHVYSIEIEISELLRDFEASPPLLSVHRFQATDGLTDEVWESRRIAEKTSAKWDLESSMKAESEPKYRNVWNVFGALQSSGHRRSQNGVWNDESTEST